MNAHTDETWCDHEFVLTAKKDGRTLVHKIQLLNSGDVACDEISDGAGKPVRRIVQTTDQRWETEFNERGEEIGTRNVVTTEGVTIIHENARKTSHTEKFCVAAPDGSLISTHERRYVGLHLHSEVETEFNPDGSAQTTTTTLLDPQGAIIKREQIIWHTTGKPAICEITHFDAAGCASKYKKSMHATDGHPLWQEKLYFASSAQPYRKEVMVFTRNDDRVLVDTADFSADGKVQKRDIRAIQHHQNSSGTLTAIC